MHMEDDVKQARYLMNIISLLFFDFFVSFYWAICFFDRRN